MDQQNDIIHEQLQSHYFLSGNVEMFSHLQGSEMMKFEVQSGR